MEHTHATEIELENLREELSEKRLTEFVESLANEENLDAQRWHLISLASKALNALVDTEHSMLVNYLKSEKDSICPGCLMAHSNDVTLIETTAEMFNKYLDPDNEHAE